MTTKLTSKPRLQIQPIASGRNSTTMKHLVPKPNPQKFMSSSFRALNTYVINSLDWRQLYRMCLVGFITLCFRGFYHLIFTSLLLENVIRFDLIIMTKSKLNNF